jgi:NAD(P)-dependent dehydrogenase (short-subunit alcohol dehydrogenase family)
MTGRVEGKIALITGGAQGLGEATARMLVREGCRVVITDVNEKGAQAVAASINAQYKGAAIAFRHDVTKEDEWIAAIAEAERAFGGLHILVNNAGIGLTKDLEAITLEEWRLVHAIDLDGVFLGCKHAVALIAKTAQATKLGGSIVNISSISGIIAGHNMAAYNSAKAAVRHLSKSVALYCARKGYNIRSNSVHRCLSQRQSSIRWLRVSEKRMPTRNWDARFRSAISASRTTLLMRCSISPPTNPNSSPARN